MTTRTWPFLHGAAAIAFMGALIATVGPILRMLGRADQKVGKDAEDRYADLVKQLAAWKAEFERPAGPTSEP